MARTTIPAAVALFALGALLRPAGLPAQELTEATYEKWRDHVLPRPDDLAYQRIAWRPSFWEAVVEAQEKDQPILLWVMNGHALCNT